MQKRGITVYVFTFYIISVLVIDLISNQLIISFGYVAYVISASVFFFTTVLGFFCIYLFRSGHAVFV